MHVRLATHSDLRAVVRILIEAFDDDPSYGYIFRSNQLKSRWLETLTRLGTEMTLNNGVVWIADKEGSTPSVGAALWYPSNCPYPPPWYRLLGLVWKMLPLYLYPSTIFRIQHVQKQLLALRPRGLKRHWFLATLAVRSDQRGGGLGSLLVREGMTRAAAEQVPVFLQAWTRNVPFYERLGFSSVSRFELPNCPGSCHGLIWQPPTG